MGRVERYQNNYETIEGRNVIFGRFNRIKLCMANFGREELLKQQHEKRKQATMIDKVEEAIKLLTKNSKAINLNSVAVEAE